jgi:hypothetical protein
MPYHEQNTVVLFHIAYRETYKAKQVKGFVRGLGEEGIKTRNPFGPNRTVEDLQTQSITVCTYSDQTISTISALHMGIKRAASVCSLKVGWVPSSVGRVLVERQYEIVYHT